MILLPSLPGDAKLLEIVELYPNNCYIFFYALKGAHNTAPEKVNELVALIQEWCRKQRQLLEERIP